MPQDLHNRIADRPVHDAMISIMAVTWGAWSGVVVGWLLGLPAAVLVAVGLARWRRRSGWQASWAWRSAFADVGMVVGTAPWIWMILTPRGSGRTLSLVPLCDMVRQIGEDPTVAWVQIVANLAVFATFGALAGLRWGLGPARVAAIAATGSTTVEILQYLIGIGRVSSVDDVALNAAGAVLAWSAVRWCRKRRRPAPDVLAVR